MHKNPLQKGFTLIETMVAISILLLATLGPLQIASQGLNQALFARDQVTAYYLADEAIEYIRNYRDSNSLIGQDWLAGLSNCLNGNSCNIDANTLIDATDPSTQPVACSSGSSCSALYTDETGIFAFPTNSVLGSQPKASPFTRTITMTVLRSDANGPAEVQVKVLMSWKTGTIAKSFTLSETLDNINS